MAAALPQCNFGHSGASAKRFQRSLIANMKLNEEMLVFLSVFLFCNFTNFKISCLQGFYLLKEDLLVH
jgi:hypothetical protein